MKRRSFLKLTVFGSAGIVLFPQRNLLSTRPNRIIHVPRKKIQWQWTVVELFAQFALSVAAEVIGDEINKWINDLQKRGNNSAASEAINSRNQMINFGFINDDQSTVYYFIDNMYSYMMIDKDGFNCCAPFLGGTEQALDLKGLVEGPTIAGLSTAGTDHFDWKMSEGYSSAEAREQTSEIVVPQAQITVPPSQRFRSSYASPAAYETQYGSMEINYTRLHGEPNVGLIEMQAIPRSRHKPVIQFEPIEIQYPASYNQEL